VEGNSCGLMQGVLAFAWKDRRIPQTATVRVPFAKDQQMPKKVVDFY
jgi:hypothetical protein